MKKFLVALTIMAALYSISLAEERLKILKGVVREKPSTVKSLETWNAPPGPYYYVLDMGKKSIILRPSDTIKTADLKKLSGQQVALAGYFVTGKTYKPQHKIEQYPIEQKPDGKGWQPAKRGAGFVVIRNE